MRKIFSIILLFLLPGLSFSEEEKKNKEPKQEEKKEEPKLKVDFDEGFWLENEFYKLNIGGYVEIDGIAFTSAKYGNDQFIVRRARLWATGEYYSLFGFALVARWDRCEVELHQAYVETLNPDWLLFRAGLFKEPFSLEATYSDTILNFDERSLVVHNYVHIEDIGLMVFGEQFCEQLEYYFGVFNGTGRDVENNNAKEVVARLVYGYRGLYLGVSASNSKQDTNLTGEEFICTAAEIPFWEWAGTSANPVVVNDYRRRWGADVEWFYGPGVLRAEGVIVDWGKVHNNRVSRHFSGYGWYAEGSYLLTGECKLRDEHVVPWENFGLCGGIGAWELAARYEVFQASKRVLKAGLATGADRVHGPTIAVNWYLNPFICIKANWQYLRFSEKIVPKNTPVEQEQAFTIRVQALF